MRLNDFKKDGATFIYDRYVLSQLEQDNCINSIPFKKGAYFDNVGNLAYNTKNNINVYLNKYVYRESIDKTFIDITNKNREVIIHDKLDVLVNKVLNSFKCDLIDIIDSQSRNSIFNYEISKEADYIEFLDNLNNIEADMYKTPNTIYCGGKAYRYLQGLKRYIDVNKIPDSTLKDLNIVNLSDFIKDNYMYLAYTSHIDGLCCVCDIYRKDTNKIVSYLVNNGKPISEYIIYIPFGIVAENDNIVRKIEII